MKVKEDKVLELILDEALNYGLNQAYKHTDTPSREAIKERVVNEFWVAYYEFFEDV